MTNKNGKGRVDTPKSIKQMLKDKELYTVQEAADILGYTVGHLRKLCAAKKVGHVKRGDGGDIYLKPGHAADVMVTVDASSNVSSKSKG